MSKAKKYDNWTKICLTNEQTKILYEAMNELLPNMKPLLRTFDNGYFLTVGDEVYLSKLGELKPFSKTCNTRKKLVLAVLQVYGELYFRLFVTIKTFPWYSVQPILETNPATIQISSKEQVLNEIVKIPNISNKEEYMLKHGLTVVKDRVMKKTPLLKNHLIIQYWPQLLQEDNVRSILGNLKDNSSFSSQKLCIEQTNTQDSKLTIHSYRKVFQEIRG
jgi:hypothetical protein